MRRECRERIPRHRGLEIPTCIMARTWRRCRDACWDRKLALSFEVGGGYNIIRACATRNPPYLVRGHCHKSCKVYSMDADGLAPLVTRKIIAKWLTYFAMNVPLASHWLELVSLVAILSIWNVCFESRVVCTYSHNCFTIGMEPLSTLLKDVGTLFVSLSLYDRN